MNHPCPDMRAAPKAPLSESPAEQQFLEIIAAERFGPVIPAGRRVSHRQIVGAVGEKVVRLGQLE
jgi:hypothetical protein